MINSLYPNAVTSGANKNEQEPGPSIAMVTGSLSRRAGGLFHSVRHLSHALSHQGARVSVIGIRDADTSADLEHWLPLEPIVLDRWGPSQLGFAPRLRATLRTQAPDIIHQHGIWQSYSIETSRWATKVPTMISPRGMLDRWALKNSRSKKRLAWHLWEAKNLNHASRIHALAQAEAVAISAVIPKAVVTVIPNGVSTPACSHPSRNERAVRELLFLGRIHPKKGLLDLLTQWSHLPKEVRSKWRVTVAGPDEGGHRKMLKKFARQKGLEAEFQFVGPLTGEAKEEAFSRANAFVLPSYSEGLPMAVLEAWAHELPVFMTRYCNLPEGFDSGAAAEIQTGHDPAGLHAALSQVDLAEMGRKGRRLVEDRFSWDIVAARHMEEYRSMLAAFGKPR